jgi:hypothetical protein
MEAVVAAFNVFYRSLRSETEEDDGKGQIFDVFYFPSGQVFKTI